MNTVGFIDDNALLLWRFFNAFSLALLAIFEALAFFLLFARLMKVVLHKRRRELMGGTGEVHHFRGIVLINLGMLLSLVETLIGFADQSFPLAFIRRGMKAAGRILILLGLLRGSGPSLLGSATRTNIPCLPGGTIWKTSDSCCSDLQRRNGFQGSRPYSSSPACVLQVLRPKYRCSATNESPLGVLEVVHRRYTYDRPNSISLLS